MSSTVRVRPEMTASASSMPDRSSCATRECVPCFSRNARVPGSSCVTSSNSACVQLMPEM